MKIISNYLEEGLGGAGAEAKQEEERFRLENAKTTMAAMIVQSRPFCTGAKISEKRERGGSTLMSEDARRESEGQNADSSTPFSNSVLGTFDNYLFFCQNHGRNL